MFAYTVYCSIRDSSVAHKWVEWLKTEHMQDVIDAGATSAKLHVLDPLVGTCADIGKGQHHFQVHYVFADRMAFERYEKEHAPRLRAEGLSHFPIELGLSYSRSVAQIIPCE